jgi:hypothetical protein
MAINGVFAIWSNPTLSYPQRVSSIRSGSALSPKSAVRDDLATDIDVLKGESGFDWLFAGARDQITVNEGERVEDL